MAVGKCSDETDIDPDAVRVTFGGHEVFGGDGTATDLGGVEAYLRGDEVELGVDLGISEGRWTVYGCDLTEEYVRFNSEYTT
jgi:glutamate N-acetyltransferase/amino-acid N-acetyltransferase